MSHSSSLLTQPPAFLNPVTAQVLSCCPALQYLTGASVSDQMIDDAQITMMTPDNVRLSMAIMMINILDKFLYVVNKGDTHR
jgi:hypothetical protein